MKKGQFIFIASLLLFCHCSRHAHEDTEMEECIAAEMKSGQSEEVRISESGDITLTPAQFQGMKLFMKHCNKCHPGGEKGKGPALNDKGLPNFLIHWQVRLGVGKMPQFKKGEISKEEVKQIIAFVRLLRHTGAG